MTRYWPILRGFIVLVLFAASCAPQTGPAPAPPTAAPPAAPISPKQTASAATPEEAAWAKVMETAKKEGKLNIYSFNMTGDIGIAVSRAFESKYGVKLDIITGGGAALAERIRIEKRMGTMVADVMDANTFQTSNIKDIGATISADDLPALKEKGVWLVEPWANDPQKHKLIHTVLYYTPVINTSQIRSSDEPKSLKELAQPKWKGKMTGYDPRQNSGHYNYFMPLLKRKLIDIDTVQAIGKNEVVWTATSTDAVQNTMRGQYPLYLGGGATTFATFVATEPSLPVKVLDMEEGVVAYNLAIALVKDGPHPNAARLLVNWMFTQEGQNIFVKAKALVPVRKDVPDYTPTTLRITPNRLVVFTGEEEEEYVKLFREGYLAKLWGK